MLQRNHMDSQKTEKEGERTGGECEFPWVVREFFRVLSAARIKNRGR